VTCRPRGLEQREQRCVAHAHAAALRNVRGTSDEHGPRSPAILGVGCHRKHGVHRAGLEQPLAETRRDARPLRAGARLDERGPKHAAKGSEVEFVTTDGIARRPRTCCSSAG